MSAKGQNRTDDTSIFSAVLYQLSYLGLLCDYYIMSPKGRQAPFYKAPQGS